jgi:SHS2 domain-containing protein
VAGYGPSPAVAFEQAALALTAIICDLDAIEPAQSVAIEREDGDLELLFVDWLNALVYEMDTRHMLFSRFSVQIAGTHLAAEAWGEPIAPARHQPAVGVKGATYTALAVEHDPSGTWSARCVVDL